MVVYLRRIPPWEPSDWGFTPTTTLRIKKLGRLNAIVGRIDGQPIYLSGIAQQNIQTLRINLRPAYLIDSTTSTSLESSLIRFRRKRVARAKKVRFDEITDIKPPTKATKEPEWWPYREDISSLEDYPDALEYTPDDGESLRKIRVRVTKAAKSIPMEVRNSETIRGTLLVYKPPTEGRRRTRRAKNQ